MNIDKLKRRHHLVLSCLGAQGRSWTPAGSLPDGNGRTGGATGVTLRELINFEAGALIEYGKEPSHSRYGYRITGLGRTALASLSEKHPHVTGQAVTP